MKRINTESKKQNGDKEEQQILNKVYSLKVYKYTNVHLRIRSSWVIFPSYREGRGTDPLFSSLLRLLLLGGFNALSSATE